MIYQKTGGWIGHRMPGALPSLLLHTMGAKTGQPRTTSLTYARDGDSYPEQHFAAHEDLRVDRQLTTTVVESAD